MLSVLPQGGGLNFGGGFSLHCLEPNKFNLRGMNDDSLNVPDCVGLPVDVNSGQWLPQCQRCLQIFFSRNSLSEQLTSDDGSIFQIYMCPRSYFRGELGHVIFVGEREKPTCLLHQVRRSCDFDHDSAPHVLSRSYCSKQGRSTQVDYEGRHSYTWVARKKRFRRP